MRNYILDRYYHTESALYKVAFDYQEPIFKAAKAIAFAYKLNRKVLICGNGGSAADASHMAAELVGVLDKKDRRALGAIALNDPSTLTALGNDMGYDKVFSRQVEALGDNSDVLVAISTSGNSRNVIEAAKTAHSKALTVITLTGGNGGELEALGDINICVDSTTHTGTIQEVHAWLIHTIVGLMDECFISET